MDVLYICFYPRRDRIKKMLSLYYVTVSEKDTTVVLEYIQSDEDYMYTIINVAVKIMTLMFYYIQVLLMH